MAMASPPPCYSPPSPSPSPSPPINPIPPPPSTPSSSSPSKTKNMRFLPDAAAEPNVKNVCDLPEIECDHGHGPCTAKVSRSSNNPGRIYYACSLLQPNGSKCRFFKWYDQLKVKTKNGTTTTTAADAGGASGRPLSLTLSRSDYPMCSCGAGLCRLMLKTCEPNAGRFYFVCPITKGHGACPFFLWYDGQANTGLTAHLDESRHDGSLKSSLNGHESVGTVNYYLDKNDEPSLELLNRMTFESAEIENIQPSPTFDIVPFGPSENEHEPMRGREEHDTSNMETSTKFSNLQVVLRENLVQEVGLMDPIMEKAPQVSQKKSLQAEIHHQKIEFWRQSSAAGDTLTGDRSHQILGLQILGWLGRLVFTPSGCLTVPPSKPFLCCAFPSLDPISIPKETYEFHSEGLIDLPHSPSHSDFHSSPKMPSEDDARPLSGVLSELSAIKNPLGPLQDSVVTGTIVEALEQAALPIQNMLLTLLESMDPVNYESMTWAADCTFAALDHLSVDYRPFSERVRKFIGCASSLAEIERSIHNDFSSQELIKWYHSEKDRFDNISHTHADIVGAFTSSGHRLQSLLKEASRVREMLLQIETQVCLCEAETSELKIRVGETSKDMIESEKRLQAAAQKAEAAKELCRQREVARNAAKTAFEEARVKLR